MINEFFILGIIFIPYFILKLEDLQKIVTAIVYVNILYYIYSYYTDPISKFLFDGLGLDHFPHEFQVRLVEQAFHLSITSS